jgi:hypothetical protein
MLLLGGRCGRCVLVHWFITGSLSLRFTFTSFHFHFQFVHFCRWQCTHLLWIPCVLGYLPDSLLFGSRWSWSPYVSLGVFSGSPPLWFGGVYVSLYWLCCVVKTLSPACSVIYVVSARLRAMVEIAGLSKCIMWFAIWWLGCLIGRML